MVGDIQSPAHLYPLCHLFFYFKKNQFQEREAHMKYIELFWNRLYYCIFKCDKKTQTLLNRLFEGLFYYLKSNRNRKGNNTRIPYNEIVGICVSDYIMIGFTCLLIWTLYNFVSILLPCVSLQPLSKNVFILVSAVPGLSINYLFYGEKINILSIGRCLRKIRQESDKYGIT